MARLLWHGDLVDQRVREAAAQGLWEAAEHLLEYANRTVPIDEGMLQDSGQASIDRSQLKAVVSYDTPYAVRQHEELTYQHAPGRRAKWLELSLEERREALQQYIANRIRQGLGDAR